MAYSINKTFVFQQTLQAVDMNDVMDTTRYHDHKGVASTGGAIANEQLEGAAIKNGEITNDHITTDPAQKITETKVLFGNSGHDHSGGVDGTTLAGDALENGIIDEDKLKATAFDGTTIEGGGGATVGVKAGGITSTQISTTAVDNSTLDGGGGSAVKVKNLGITSAQLASDAVTWAKMADDSFGSDQLRDSLQLNVESITTGASKRIRGVPAVSLFRGWALTGVAGTQLSTDMTSAVRMNVEGSILINAATAGGTYFALYFELPFDTYLYGMPTTLDTLSVHHNITPNSYINYTKLRYYNAATSSFVDAYSNGDHENGLDWKSHAPNLDLSNGGVTNRFGWYLMISLYKNNIAHTVAIDSFIFTSSNHA
jgi:hypothetical protein